MNGIVIFVNLITEHIEQMPVAMINAYVPFATHLHLEEAANVAAIRDDEAARNLELSCTDTEYLVLILEGAPSLR
jgi:hypothetical protein